jgi:hypothetical protein
MTDYRIRPEPEVRYLFPRAPLKAELDSGIWEIDAQHVTEAGLKKGYYPANVIVELVEAARHWNSTPLWAEDLYYAACYRLESAIDALNAESWNVE